MLNKWLLWFYVLCVADLMNGDNLGEFSADRFGPARLHVSKVIQCRGPKSKNCSDITIQYEDEYSTISFIYNVTKKTKVDKLKISTWLNKNNTFGPPDYNKLLDGPCNHFIMGPVLKIGFRLKPNSKDCRVEKGSYTLKVSTKKMFEEYFGKKFFYGSYKCRASLFNKDCNMACVYLEFVLDKLEP